MFLWQNVDNVAVQLTKQTGHKADPAKCFTIVIFTTQSFTNQHEENDSLKPEPLTLPLLF